jgi:3,4-dihydroxy 2-butanone 4-phosphate synthase / GTP cyclohydrolase II
MIIVCDDESRENECDLIMAAEFATKSKVAFMIRFTSGIICIPMTGDRLDRLNLPLMVEQNTDAHKTAFTVTVDYKHGTTTGVSAADRTKTILALADEATNPEDLTRPGHIFPLRARDGGLAERSGHTEASVDLCRLAGLKPVAVISELTLDNGEMMRRKDALEFAANFDLKIICVQQIKSSFP